MLELVRLTGATQIHHLKRKDRTGHVEYWKAQCGESRMLRLEGGKGRKALPIPTTLSCLQGVHTPKLYGTIYR